MRRIRLVVAYDGTGFHGWQVQPGLPTIQGCLEDIIAEIEKGPVQVAGSGRTDAGVHALAQVAAVSLESDIPLANLKKAVNRLLPPAIRIASADEVHEQFHPRFDAVSKTYEYRIWRGDVLSPFDARYLHHHPFPMDDERLIGAAALFTGEHDFSAFSAADEAYRPGKPNIRRIFVSEASRDGDLLRYRVTGSGFLKHMVRNIAGTLIEAGKGNAGHDRIQWLLTAPPHVRATPTAPAKGLFLVEVHY